MNELYDLDIDEISFVDKGANQHADIVLMKRDGRQLKTEGGKQYPAEAFAYTPDYENPSTWKLRLWESPEVKVTRAQVGRAVAALGEGFRGQKVDIPMEDLQSVKNTVLEAWIKVNDEMTRDDAPEILTKVENMPTVEELQAKVDELQSALDGIKAENEKLKAEHEEMMAKSKGDDKGGEAGNIEKLELPESVRKHLEDIEKKAQESEAKIAKMEDEKSQSQWISKCADIKVEKGEEVAKALHTVAKSNSDEAEMLYSTIKTLFAQVEKGDLFKERGNSGGRDVSAEDQITSKAKKLVEDGAFDTFAKAYAHIYKTDKPLREQVQKGVR